MHDIWRIIDANLNRASEGLRVVEEVARFIMEDEKLTREIKQCRHQLAEICRHPAFQYDSLVAAREAEGDVGGIRAYSSSEGHRGSYRDIVVANIKRVQEAARSLEEFSKLLCPEIGFSFKQFRFHTYTLEKNLADALRYRDRLVPCWDICVITGDCRYKGRSAAEVVSQAIAGGAMIIQLREMELTTRRLVETGRHIREITRKAGALFLIDGHVDVALAVGADGVHLGQDEMQIKDVRMLLGDRKIIGASAGSVEEACLAEQEGADFIEIGPVFPTGDAQAPQGLQLIRNIKKAVRIPCLAAGGINHDNISGVIRAGADGAAISTAVVSADDIQAAAAGLKQIVLNTKE